MPAASEPIVELLLAIDALAASAPLVGCGAFGFAFGSVDWVEACA